MPFSIILEKFLSKPCFTCSVVQSKDYMTERFAQSLKSLVERLDIKDGNWAEHWKENKDEYLKGHWMRQPGGDSWTIPKSVVEAIKGSGLRADDPKVKALWKGENESE